MNSRNNSDKDSKTSNGWGRRDNRQPRFKKDFSSQDFYNQDWRNKPKKTSENIPPKNDKNYNISDNYQSLNSNEFKWINQCLLE